MGSLSHCAGGDGLGIITAMVGARLLGFSFWEEFWFENLVGFAFGRFIFQMWSFVIMGNGYLTSVWKAFGAEFWSMLTVMLGMGLVMRLVTPAVVGEQPTPYTYAPSGDSPPSDCWQASFSRSRRIGFSCGSDGNMECINRRVLMALIAAAAAAAPWAGSSSAAEPRIGISKSATSERIGALASGLMAALTNAESAFRVGRRSDAVQALDGAHRVVKVAVHAATAGLHRPLGAVEHQIKKGRTSVQNGDVEGAREHLAKARETLFGLTGSDRRPARLGTYISATLISVEGRKLGEIESFDGETATVTIGHWQDTLGFLDFGGRIMEVPSSELVFGPSDQLGLILAVLSNPAVGRSPTCRGRRLCRG